jgi:hypothetical protein
LYDFAIAFAIEGEFTFYRVFDGLVFEDAGRPRWALGRAREASAPRWISVRLARC